MKADGGDAVAKVDTAVKAPRLWSAEDPYLYTLVLQLKAGRSIDIRTCKVGFREVELKNGTILFNGKKIKFKGVNRHETDAAEGRSISRETMLKDILLMKRHNINTVRTSHYPDHYYWYRLCDRYGVYLVAEGNVETHGMGYGKESLSHFDSWKAAHVERNVNQVENYKNHPSIFMWSMGNEAGPGLNFKAAIDAVHALDSTRPVHYERANNFADVDSRMYPTVEWLYERGMNTEKPFFLANMRMPWVIRWGTSRSIGMRFIPVTLLQAVVSGTGLIRLYGSIPAIQVRMENPSVIWRMAVILMMNLTTVISSVTV